MDVTMSKNILVAGGAGFLGSHLVESMVRAGNHVTIIDNLRTSNIKNIRYMLGGDQVRFVRESIVNIDPWSTRVNLPKKHYDEVWNLACPASPPLYQKDPIFTLDTNYLGTKNLLQLALVYNAKFFQASTSEVYGDPEVHPQPESYWGNTNTVGIRSCYDEGKRVAETLCVEYSRMYDLQTRIVRIFNTYGPRLASGDGRVVSNFIKQALAGEMLTVYGDGLQTRSFCYVDDLIRGFHLLMESDINAEPVNLGNPGEFSILQLAEIVKNLTNSNSNLVFMPLPGDDPKQRKPDINKAKNLLGWEPKITLEEGLAKMIGYIQNQTK